MMNRSLILYFVLSSSSLFAETEKQATPVFRDQDKVCWVGDSITASGLYHSYIYLYYSTRFPSLHLSFVNCGISGDNASGMLGRLDKDVYANHPTTVTLSAGMNDVNRNLYSQTNAPTNAPVLQKQALDGYKKNIEKLGDSFAAHQIRQIYLTPTIYDEDVESSVESLRGVNGALRECSDFVLQFAHSKNMPVVNFWHPMDELNRKMQKSDPKFTLTSKDRVHPGPSGHLLMAYLFLDQTGAPQDVWRLSIDAKSPKVLSQTNCEATGLASNPKGLTFSNHELALPFPSIADAKDVFSWVPFHERLNQQALQISHLDEGNYSLQINQAEVGQYSATELEKGINLAINPKTPQSAQSQKIAALCQEHYTIGNTIRTLRRVEMKHLQNVDLNNRATVQASLNKLIEEKQAQKNDPGANSGYYIKTAKTYLSEIQKEPEMYLRLQAIQDQIHFINQPQSYSYSIKPITPLTRFHAQGELAGEVTDHSVLLQSRITSIPGPLLDAKGDIPGMGGRGYFEWSENESLRPSQRTSLLEAKAEFDFIIRASIAGLRDGTRYFYRLVHENGAPGPTRTFQTLSPSGDHVSFCIGNCMNYYPFISGTPNGDGPVTATPEDKQLGYPSFAAMQKLNPDFFIGAGDIVYYDFPKDSPAQTVPQLRKKWHEQFRFPRLISFFGGCGTYWMKDDHDFRYDDADLSGQQLPSVTTGRDLFREQMPIHPAEDMKSPNYRTYRVSRNLQIWFLEGRDYRSDNKSPADSKKSIWGDAQRKWLEATLQSSPAKWKIIVSPTPLVGPDRASKSDNHTNLNGFRNEADSFFQWLTDTKIQNVLILCGDRHWQYHSIHPSGVEELCCGALNDENSIRGIAPGDPISTDPQATIRQPYLYSIPTGGFLHVNQSPNPKGIPSLTFSFYDDTGKLLHQVMKESP
jgi:alkaline phosphatase/alkaline phosphatase D